MRVTVCEISDDRDRFAGEWELLGEHARKESSDLVLLPEMPFYYWFCAEPKFDKKVWNEAVGEHRSWVERIRELRVSVVLGSRPVDAKERRLNEGFIWSPERAKGVHFKSYLPNESGYYESSWYNRGDRVFSSFEAGPVKAGFMICTDLWSMRHAREYGREGVHVIAAPRATGKTSIEKWLAGGKVAAVVSGAYCISSNRTGKRGEAEFGGRGWVIDPDGEVLGLTSQVEPFVTVDVDPKTAEKAKESYPRNSLKPD